MTFLLAKSSEILKAPLAIKPIVYFSFCLNPIGNKLLSKVSICDRIYFEFILQIVRQIEIDLFSMLNIRKES